MLKSLSIKEQNIMGRFSNESYSAPGSMPQKKETSVKAYSEKPAIQKRFQEVLGDKAAPFIASVIGAVNGNPALQKADPASVFGSAMIAATLNLSVVPTLGQAAIVPYKGNAQFQIMVRGLVQLAQRTGLYKTINAGEVYKDEYDGEDLLTGEVTFHRVHGGDRDNGRTENIVGYFAYFETTTGFKKTEYWTKEDVQNHGRRFSKSYNNGPWKDNFDAMAKKTVLKSLINHYGPMSVDTQLAQAISKDQMVVDNAGHESYADNPMDDMIITGVPADDEKTPTVEPTEENEESIPNVTESPVETRESAPEQSIEEYEEFNEDDELNI